MHWKCKIFGHKYTKRIENKSMFFADNHYCECCDAWSNQMPQEWFFKWGNGLLPDLITNVKAFFRFEVFWRIERLKFWKKEDLPF